MVGRGERRYAGAIDEVATMVDDRGDELRALRQVVETCRAQAIDLDLPALGYILGKVEASLAAHSAHRSVPQIPRGPALSVPRGRVLRH